MTAIKTRSNFSWKTPLVLGACVAAAMLLPLGCTSSTGGGDDCPAQDANCLTKEQFLAKGDTVFQQNCKACHGVNGDGDGEHGNNPPLHNSSFFVAERLRPVRIVTLGLPNRVDTATTITVNGTQYTGYVMPAVLDGFSDLEVAAVLSFVRDSLNGHLLDSLNIKRDLITVKEVATMRAAYPPE